MRGHWRLYTRTHPTAADVGLVIESSDSTLDSDRADKQRLYARDAIPHYWNMNINARQLEVYSQPVGDTYVSHVDYREGDSVPLILDGVEVAQLLVADLLP